MDCFHRDIGPAVILEWEEQGVLTAGKVLVFPFSHGPATDGEQYGRIAVVGATGASEQGYDLRMWFSAAPGGSPLEGFCAMTTIADDVVGWNQNKDVSGYCRLPDEAGTVFFNYALCTAPADDFPCLGDSAEFAAEDYRFHMAGTAISY